MNILEILFSAGGRAFLLACCLAVSGCSAPQWRVFQSKVPAPLVKPLEQIEYERSAADLIARKITAPSELIPVARKLSESLGVPSRPILYDDIVKACDEALARLQAGLKQQQEELCEMNKRLAQYDGKKIEGTGVNVFGFAVSLPIIGLIALCIFFPSTIGVLWWLLKKSRGALVATIKGVQDFKDSQPVPEVVTELNASLSKKMDDSHKKLVKKIKATL